MKEMIRKLIYIFFLAMIGAIMLSSSCRTVEPSEVVEQIKLPKGFNIEIYAKDVKGARSMAMSDGGILFVGSRSPGNIYAIIDENNDMSADTVITIATGLNSPNGVALHNGDLYVAEIGRIIKYVNIEENIYDVPEPEVVNDQFPKETHHGWKYIAFGPDGKLYVPVGAPCNNCLSEDSIFATITRMDPDGSDLEIYASGIRNTVGFDWHPETDILWFTDNGRDWSGDNIPPDELNKAPREGMHFGYPFCHGNSYQDPKYGSEGDCQKYIAPVQELGPHVAALGMKFYTGNMFPEEYHGRIFIAEHGSWNRTIPIGYRVTMVTLDEQQRAIDYTPFAEGWLQGRNKLGRPVDILIMKDGSMLVSDDHGDTIYRIFYK